MTTQIERIGGITPQDRQRTREIDELRIQFKQALGTIPGYNDRWNEEYHYIDGTTRGFKGTNGDYGVYESDDKNYLIVTRRSGPVEEKVHIHRWRRIGHIAYLLADGGDVIEFTRDDDMAFNRSRNMLKNLQGMGKT